MVLDSWAWWEILAETPEGRRLSTRYLEAPGVRVLTVDYTLAEVAAKLARMGHQDRVSAAVAGMDRAAEVVPVDLDVAAMAATLLIELRRTDARASLADAVVLAAARAYDAILISGDPCFAGQKDVRSS